MGPRHDFGPPGRSMTMPVQDSGARQAMPAPQRVDSMPFSGPAGRGMPPRPSTTTGTRPVPQRTYPEDASANNQYGGAYHDSRGYGNQPAPAVDDFFDSYFDNDPVGNTDHGSQAPPHRSSLPDFDSAPPQRRGSFEQAMLPGPQQPHQALIRLQDCIMPSQRRTFASRRRPCSRWPAIYPRFLQSLILSHINPNSRTDMAALEATNRCHPRPAGLAYHLVLEAVRDPEVSLAATCPGPILDCHRAPIPTPCPLIPRLCVRG